MGDHRFSIRALMVLIVFAALFMLPVVWVARQREAALQARAEMREVLLAERDRAALLAQKSASAKAIRSADPKSATGTTSVIAGDAASRIERLERENAELKKTIEVLRRKEASRQAAEGAAARKPGG
jgi:hypothetical protein